MLLREAEKPRNEQRIKADLFLEVYKSLHAIERHTPEVFERVTKRRYVDSMVGKYLRGVVDNVVGYRDVSKIARAESAGVDKRAAAPVILRLVKDDNYSIKQAFEDSVQEAYARRDLLAKVQTVTAKLADLRSGVEFDEETRGALEQLRAEITRLLRH